MQMTLLTALVDGALGAATEPQRQALSPSSSLELIDFGTFGQVTWPHARTPEAMMGLNTSFPTSMTAGAIGGMVALMENHTTDVLPGEKIPRNIWTFWNTPFFPTIVGACVKAMHMRNPGWTVRLVVPNASGVEGAPWPESKEAFEKQPALESDWYRVSAMAAYGGVWLDTTTLTNIPLGTGDNPWPDMSLDAVQGFNCPNTENTTHPMCMESFAFAAPPNNSLILAWKDEFRKALTMGCDKYADSLTDAVIGNLREHLPYLCVYAAFQAAHDKQKTAKVFTHPSQGCLMPGGKCGPYHFMDYPEWHQFSHLQRLFGFPKGKVGNANSTEFNQLTRTPIIKFMSGHRQTLIEKPQLWQDRSSHIGSMLVSALPNRARKELVEWNGGFERNVTDQIDALSQQLDERDREIADLKRELQALRMAQKEA
jgi:hypothetical protein